MRRCSLDGVGLASWEDPTHIKCISKNYENIQTLVSLRKIHLCFLIPFFRRLKVLVNL